MSSTSSQVENEQTETKPLEQSGNTKNEEAESNDSLANEPPSEKQEPKETDCSDATCDVGPESTTPNPDQIKKDEESKYGKEGAAARERFSGLLKSRPELDQNSVTWKDGGGHIFSQFCTLLKTNGVSMKSLEFKGMKENAFIIQESGMIVALFAEKRVGLEELKLLSEAMKRNTTLSELDLSGNEKDKSNNEGGEM